MCIFGATISIMDSTYLKHNKHDAVVAKFFQVSKLQKMNMITLFIESHLCNIFDFEIMFKDTQFIFKMANGYFVQDINVKL